MVVRLSLHYNRKMVLIHDKTRLKKDLRASSTASKLHRREIHIPASEDSSLMSFSPHFIDLGFIISKCQY